MVSGPHLSFLEIQRVYINSFYPDYQKQSTPIITPNPSCSAMQIFKNDFLQILFTFAAVFRLSFTNQIHLPPINLSCAGTNKHLPYVTVTVNGNILSDVLIDTGAGLTIINSRLIKNLLNVTFYPSQLNAVLANGKVMTFSHSAFITITIFNKTSTILACVLPDAPTQLTVGTDFLYHFPQVTFNWRSKEMHIRNSVVPLEGTHFLKPISQGIVKLDASVVLPSSSNC